MRLIQSSPAWALRRCHLGILFVALLLIPGISSAQEWPQYRGNPGFTGLSTDASVKPPLKLQWSYRLDGDASGDAGAGVVVGGGIVFSPVHNTRSLVAIDAHTGRFLWEFRDPANSYLTVPTYHQGLVFLWQRGKAKQFTIIALDAKTGAEQWRHDMRGEQGGQRRVGLPIYDNRIYCTEGGDDPSLFALDAATGKLIWRSPLGNEDGLHAITPCVAGGRVFAAICNGSGFRKADNGALVAFDATSGKELWRYRGIFPNRSLVSDGKIVVCNMFARQDTKGYTLDAETGKLLWTSAAQFHYNPPTITGDMVLIRPYGAPCIALDRLTGKKLWNFDIPKVNSGCCAPAVSGKYAYYGMGVVSPGDLESVNAFQHLYAPREQGISGAMHAIDLDTGKSVWRFGTGNCICGDPAIAYGKLYFTSRDGCVYCFTPAKEGEPTTPDTKDATPNMPREQVEKLLARKSALAPRPGRDWIMQGGTPLRAGSDATVTLPLERAWSADLGGRIVTSPAVRSGRVFVGSDAGKLLAFDLASGKKLWEHIAQGRIRCTPAVAEDAVYCGADDGVFVALDPATGKQLWQYQAGGPIQASPTFVGGLVIFAANDHHVYVLDRATGTKAWSARVNDYAIQAAPVVLDRQLIVAQWTDWIWSFDLATGAVNWKTYISITTEAIAVHRGKLYARNPNYLVEIDPRDGKRIGLSYASWGWGGMAFIKNRIFQSGIQSQYGTNGASFCDLDDPGQPFGKPIPTIEDIRLRKSSGLKYGPDLASMSTPLALGEKLCIAPVSGKLTVMEMDGTKLWQQPLESTCHASPIAADGYLMVGDDAGRLHVFRGK